MKRSYPLLTGIIVCLTVQMVCAADQRPNILFFFSDDLTTQAISAYQYGMDLPPTPNIDRLAGDGVDAPGPRL